MHAETLRELRRRPLGCGATRLVATKLPFAGYSVLFDIVWDDSGFARFASFVETGSARVAPERRRRGGGDPRHPSLPVVIGAGSHPFPFRTRKLSLLPPMVLCGKLHGRVGHCRGVVPPAAFAAGVF